MPEIGREDHEAARLWTHQQSFGRGSPGIERIRRAAQLEAALALAVCDDPLCDVDDNGFPNTIDARLVQRFAV